jgi:Domain of unknown function (DUF4126)
MTLFLAICLGIGIAAAVGLRPFLPALLVGSLARGNTGVDFGHTSYSFLEQPVFLLLLVVGVIALVVAERRLGPARVDAGPIGASVGGLSLGLAALLFAGVLAHHHYLSWPGLAAGIACAAVAQGAARGLFRRVRSRLDAAAQAALPFYAEVAAIVLAGLSVLAPPAGLVGLVLLAWLLVTGRRREGRKFAGLRVLR